MATRKILTSLCCLISMMGTHLVTAAEPDAAARQEPPTSWVDPDTGHRVVRLTREPGSASLYFNDNGYTPDGKRMIYTTLEGISLLDLGTYQTRSIVQGKVRVICVGKKTPTVYYLKTEENALYSTQLDSGETRKIATLPPRGRISTINADETLAAGTYSEVETKPKQNFDTSSEKQGHPLDRAPNKGQMMEERLAAKIPVAMYTLDLRTGETKTILRSTDWLNHLLFSPTDPSLLMYCHEGPWQKVDRIWTIRTDGSEKTLIHKRTMAMEIAGHEFWSQDGKTIWYDLQTPKGQVFYVAGYELATGTRTWHHLERNEWSIHFNVNNDTSLFCGDGGDPSQVAKAPDGQWLYLFRPEKMNLTDLITEGMVLPGVFRAEKLVNMAKHDYKLEPNVSFTPDQKWIVFRSNMFGDPYVFGVEIAKSATRAGGS